MTDTRTPTERRNAGWFDGVNARKIHRFPIWNKVSVYRCRHPFDKPYGEGFWAGWYGEAYPSPQLYAKIDFPVPTAETV